MDVLTILQWSLVAVLFVYFVGLMHGLGGMLALYALEGRKGFYEASVRRSGASADRLEWVLVLNHLCWPFVMLRRDPHFFAARMGTLTKTAEMEYRQTHPNWSPRGSR